LFVLTVKLVDRVEHGKRLLLNSVGFSLRDFLVQAFFKSNFSLSEFDFEFFQILLVISVLVFLPSELISFKTLNATLYFIYLASFECEIFLIGIFLVLLFFGQISCMVRTLVIMLKQLLLLERHLSSFRHPCALRHDFLDQSVMQVVLS